MNMKSFLLFVVFTVIGVFFIGCATADEVKKEVVVDATDDTPVSTFNYYYTFDLSAASDDLADFESQSSAAWITKAILDADGCSVYLLADAATASPMTNKLWGTVLYKMTKNTISGLYEATLKQSATTYNEWATGPEILNLKIVLVQNSDVVAFEANPDNNPFYGFPKGMGNLAVDYKKLVKDTTTTFFKFDNNAMTTTVYDVMTVTLK
ncbi:MAG: hypothetical protein A2015_15245 [Spirochaetes bacterium GWF1_31_7]|nr:MAG: hypothetical protein A2Y30_11670 [Spirochaetes bacterium GWE1_32_154]OHD51176.1 MAG: hypothetical protein A2Y29_01210 [Spirochaetes bacterium GWE2_31_10]OHD52095.1 MAG: hypothetical protein A2015_15245 [Spirochaetes bacterium GWF1_31_7]OHD81038.1 MAG: hypothetical protein A2355_11210 [Spirochaetes bacterium RIFOXYB1_FULL_32_8]HBD93268.1 hypothetical protein [Spirochaetia bacterium]